MTERISLTAREVADATGYSEDYIRAAWRAGNLRGQQPTVNGRQSKKPVFFRADVEAWLEGRAS